MIISIFFAIIFIEVKNNDRNNFEKYEINEKDFETITKIAKICNFEFLIKDKNSNIISTIKEMSKEKDF